MAPPKIRTLLAGICSFALLGAHPPFVWKQGDDLESLAARLRQNPPELTKTRLPHGYRIGRCLLIVRGETRISGKCAYSIAKGGAFHIDGPHSVFDGIDYPKAEIMAAMISTDYWANVFPDKHGGWTGYGNSIIGSVHGEEGDSGDWGTLVRSGACLSNHRVRVCLWKH
ncbi:MAG: hypothetical protein ACKOPE_02925 [Novosphingobium sp.]